MKALSWLALIALLLVLPAAALSGGDESEPPMTRIVDDYLVRATFATAPSTGNANELAVAVKDVVSDEVVDVKSVSVSTMASQAESVDHGDPPKDHGDAPNDHGGAPNDHGGAPNDHGDPAPAHEMRDGSMMSGTQTWAPLAAAGQGHRGAVAFESAGPNAVNVAFTVDGKRRVAGFEADVQQERPRVLVFSAFAAVNLAIVGFALARRRREQGAGR